MMNSTAAGAAALRGRATTVMPWFIGALLSLSLAAAWLLWRPAATVADERAWRFYGTRQAWLAAFDGVSAACGAGLLHGDFDHGYSSAGKWLLTATGVAGALAFLLAAAAVMRRLVGSDEDGRRVPRAPSIAAAFASWQLAVIAIAVAVETILGSDIATGDVVHRAAAAFSSLGWWPGEPAAGTLWLYVAIALAGGFGWPLWLLSFVRPAAFPARRTAVAILAGYAALILVSAGLIAALEMPRSQVRAGGERITQGGGASIARVDRGLAQGLLASTAGIPIDPWVDEAGDGSRFVLACLMTAGALPGSSGGGIRMTVFVLVIVGVWKLREKGSGIEDRGSGAELGRTASGRVDVAPRGGDGDAAQKLRVVRLAGVHYSAVVWLLLIGALGLLILYNVSASPYQAARTFADALLDAASAVAGGGLTSGMTADLLDPNLSSGMHSPVDRYQYGAAWLMLLMLAGRIVPLWLLACEARRGPMRLSAPVV